MVFCLRAKEVVRPIVYTSRSFFHFGPCIIFLSVAVSFIHRVEFLPSASLFLLYFSSFFYPFASLVASVHRQMVRLMSSVIGSRAKTDPKDRRNKINHTKVLIAEE